MREVLGVHPVDGVGQRPQHAELAGGREARAVLDVAPLLAVIPVHARDQVLVGADAGRDRGRAHGRHGRERGDARRRRSTPSRRIRASAGARPVAIARSSIAGFSASITTSTSFLGCVALTAESSPVQGQRQRRIRRPGVLLLVRRRPAISSTSSNRSATSPTGGATTDSTAISTAEPRRYSGTAEQPVASSRARTRAGTAAWQQSRSRRRSRRRSARASRCSRRGRARPRTTAPRAPAMITAEQRPSAPRTRSAGARAPPARSRRPPCQAGTALCRKREVRVVEVDLDIAGRERRRPPARAERAGCQPPRRPRSPEDVEDEMHRCCTVTDRDDRGQGARERAWRTSTGAAAVDRPGHRALRSAVRRAHEGHEVLGDARPDGADRARRRDLARRRAARHLDVPGRLLRLADEHGRGQSCARALQYGPTEGLAAVKGCIARGDGGRGHGGRPRRGARHDRRPAGDRPRLQDAARSGRRRRSAEAPTYPGRRADLLRLPGRGRPGDDGPRRDAHRRARGDARPARARRADARSSSTRSRTSTTRPG